MNNQSNSPIENEEFIKFIGLNPNQVQFIEDMDSDKLLNYINKFNNEIKNGNIESNYIDFLYIYNEKTSDNFYDEEECVVSFNFYLVKNGICKNFELETDLDYHGMLNSFTNKNDFDGICKELDDWVSCLNEIENGEYYKKLHNSKIKTTGTIFDAEDELEEKFKNIYFR